MTQQGITRIPLWLIFNKISIVIRDFEAIATINKIVLQIWDWESIDIETSQQFNLKSLKQLSICFSNNLGKLYVITLLFSLKAFTYYRKALQFIRTPPEILNIFMKSFREHVDSIIVVS